MLGFRMIFLQHFLRMPFTLRVICGVSIISPLLVCFAILDCAITQGSCDSVLGDADSMLELALTVLFSLPVCLSGIGILIRKKRIVLFTVAAWLILTFSPLLLNSVRDSDVLVVLNAVVPTAVMGVIVSCYLALSKSVKKYFE